LAGQTTFPIGTGWLSGFVDELQQITQHFSQTFGSAAGGFESFFFGFSGCGATSPAFDGESALFITGSSKW